MSKILAFLLSLCGTNMTPEPPNVSTVMFSWESPIYRVINLNSDQEAFIRQEREDYVRFLIETAEIYRMSHNSYGRRKNKA